MSEKRFNPFEHIIIRSKSGRKFWLKDYNLADGFFYFDCEYENGTSRAVVLAASEVVSIEKPLPKIDV